jgi:hypothetical protein
MRKSLLLVLASCCLFATTAVAQMEGEIDMTMATTRGNGTVKIFISKVGWRNEIDMRTPQMPIKMTMMGKLDNPDTAYSINDERKTYTEVDLKKNREMASQYGGQKSDVTYTVKYLSTDTLIGYACKHVLVTSSTGQEVELSTSKRLFDMNLLKRMQRGGNRGGGIAGSDDGMQAALKQAGAEGFPMKTVVTKGDDAVTMEVVKVDKTPPVASLFEIPAGYTKADGMGSMLPEGVRKKMEEKMKNMTPEQREMMEKMMQGNTGGGK